MKKKITLIVVAVLLVMSLVVGLSYAYWRLTYTATKVNKIVSSCFSMELTNEKNNIVLDDAYPISDEKGKSLTPYSFTITNTCDLFASYTINLEMLEGTTLNSKYVKTMINNEAITNLSTLETIDPSIEGATESRILFNGSLGSGDSTDYTLRIWMDSDTPFNEDSMNKIFQAKITVTAEVSTYSPVENGFTNLAEALLVNEYQTTSLDVAKNKIASKQEVDTTKTAPIIIWQEVHDTTYFEAGQIKVDPVEVGKYGIVDKASKIAFGKGYSFDAATGYYTLVDAAYYNPSEVDYSSQNYYMCGSSITVTENNTISYWDGVKCSTLYRVGGIANIVSSSVKLSGGDTVLTKQYIFKLYKMTETELESDKSDKGLYEDIDDDGKTYYYRGNVSNNYVKFGNYYWRVIRINGDGSIRLLYAGTSENAVGSGLRVSAGVFNNNRNNPTYVGYMYSNTLNTSYEDTIRNDNDSNIKIVLDNWYKLNIYDKGYDSYIADSGFCNDRSIAPNSEGAGIDSTETTNYGARYRINEYIPSFKCPNPTNDLFTLSTSSKGNKKLTYSIGLPTIDELAYAGLVFGNLNKLSYTYSSEHYWTMSPIYYYGATTSAVNWYAANDGSMNNANINSAYIGIRPVINLNVDTEITGGIGTKNDPFIVK